jgi:hypothetical protein
MVFLYNPKDESKSTTSLRLTLHRFGGDPCLKRLVGEGAGAGFHVVAQVRGFV